MEECLAVLVLSISNITKEKVRDCIDCMNDAQNQILLECYEKTQMGVESKVDNEANIEGLLVQSFKFIHIDPLSLVPNACLSKAPIAGVIGLSDNSKSLKILLSLFEDSIENTCLFQVDPIFRKLIVIDSGNDAGLSNFDENSILKFKESGGAIIPRVSTSYLKQQVRIIRMILETEVICSLPKALDENAKSSASLMKLVNQDFAKVISIGAKPKDTSPIEAGLKYLFLSNYFKHTCTIKKSLLSKSRTLITKSAGLAYVLRQERELKGTSTILNLYRAVLNRCSEKQKDYVLRWYADFLYQCLVKKNIPLANFRKELYFLSDFRGIFKLEFHLGLLYEENNNPRLALQMIFKAFHSSPSTFKKEILDHIWRLSGLPVRFVKGTLLESSDAYIPWKSIQLKILATTFKYALETQNTPIAMECYLQLGISKDPYHISKHDYSRFSKLVEQVSPNIELIQEFQILVIQEIQVENPRLLEATTSTCTTQNDTEGTNSLFLYEPDMAIEESDKAKPNTPILIPLNEPVRLRITLRNNLNQLLQVNLENQRELAMGASDVVTTSLEIFSVNKEKDCQELARLKYEVFGITTYANLPQIVKLDFIEEQPLLHIKSNTENKTSGIDCFTGETLTLNLVLASKSPKAARILLASLKLIEQSIEIDVDFVAAPSPQVIDGLAEISIKVTFTTPMKSIEQGILRFSLVYSGHEEHNVFQRQAIFETHLYSKQIYQVKELDVFPMQAEILSKSIKTLNFLNNMIYFRYSVSNLSELPCFLSSKQRLKEEFHEITGQLGEETFDKLCLPGTPREIHCLRSKRDIFSAHNLPLLEYRIVESKRKGKHLIESINKNLLKKISPILANFKVVYHPSRKDCYKLIIDLENLAEKTVTCRIIKQSTVIPIANDFNDNYKLFKKQCLTLTFAFMSIEEIDNIILNVLCGESSEHYNIPLTPDAQINTD